MKNFSYEGKLKKDVYQLVVKIDSAEYQMTVPFASATPEAISNFLENTLNQFDRNKK